MKKAIPSLILCLFSICLYGEESSPTEENSQPEISILEALQIVLREIPEGTQVRSIEHVQIDETTSIYYAVYDETIIAYQSKVLNAEGEYVETTKYRKVDVAAEIHSKDTFRIGILENERSRPRISSRDGRVIPRRRVVLEK